MKKVILLMVVSAWMLCLGAAVQQLPASYTDFFLRAEPFNSSWGYARSAALYTSADLGTGNKLISALEWQSDSLVTVSLPVKIYIKLTSATSLSSVTWSEISAGATLVYEGTLTNLNVGWKMITLTTPFYKDTGLGMLVLVESNYGGTGSGIYNTSIRHTYTPDGSQHLTWGSQNTPPAGPGTVSSTRPVLRITYTTYTNNTPRPAELVSPANGATNLALDVTLNWQNGGGNPTGYKLFLGTDNPPTNLVNGTDLGNVLSYDPNPLANTLYYWKIVPYNNQGDVPGCPVWNFSTGSGIPTLVFPADGAVNQNRESLTFSWNSAPNATSYRLTIGTATGAADVLNQSGLTFTSFTVPLLPSYNTTYYWKVFAVYPNSAGSFEIVSAERSFTTLPDPTIYSFPYFYGFETNEFPADGWKVVNNNADPDQWVKSQMYPRTGSFCVNIYTMGNAANDDYLIMPPVLLTGNQEFKYWVRSFSATDYDEITVLMSSTGTAPADFTTTLKASTIVNHTDYREHIISLAAHSGSRYIAFVRKNAPADGLYLFLDDVTIRDIPTAPILLYAPAEIDFHRHFQNEPSAWQNISIMNNGAGTLSLSAGDITLTGSHPSQFSFDPSALPVSLAYGQSVNLPVRFTASSEGEKTALLRISYGGSNHDISLSGTGLPANLKVFSAPDSLLRNYNLPISPAFRYSYSQSIYLQDEINTAGTIEKIWYHWHGTHGAPNSNVWTVYMGHTTEAEFDSTLTWLSMVHLTQVYSGPVELLPYKDWVEITLTTPYYYSNEDSVNLVIAVDENLIGKDESSEAFLAYPVSTDRSLQLYSDYSNPNPENPDRGSAVKAVPELLMKISGGSVVLEAPVVSITRPDGSILLSWEAVSGAIGYRVYGSDDIYAPDPWTLLTTTGSTTYTYPGTENRKFFRVTAKTEM